MKTPSPDVSDHVRAALFDIDGTLTLGNAVWAPLIRSSAVMRRKKAWLYGTVFPHYLLSKMELAKQANFRERWIRLMAWLMAGWEEELVIDMFERIVAQSLIAQLRQDVVHLLAQHVERQQPVILVSTMFDGMVERFAQQLGATAGLGTRLEVVDGVCTGRIVGQPCSGKRKAAFAQKFLEDNFPDIELQDCAIYADSASDIAFVAQGGFPVAVYPDGLMRSAAQKHGWLVFDGLGASD